MDQEVKTKLDKQLKKIRIAERFRLVFLFAALILMVFVLVGEKYAIEALWYVNSRGIIFMLLFYAVILMVISSMVKIVMVTQYNRIVKKQ